jgi:hypothetical protein
VKIRNLRLGDLTEDDRIYGESYCLWYQNLGDIFILGSHQMRRGFRCVWVLRVEPVPAIVDILWIKSHGDAGLMWARLRAKQTCCGI